MLQIKALSSLSCSEIERLRTSFGILTGCNMQWWQNQQYSMLSRSFIPCCMSPIPLSDKKWSRWTKAYPNHTQSLFYPNVRRARPCSLSAQTARTSVDIPPVYNPCLASRDLRAFCIILYGEKRKKPLRTRREAGGVVGVVQFLVRAKYLRCRQLEIHISLPFVFPVRVFFSRSLFVTFVFSLCTPHIFLLLA